MVVGGTTLVGGGGGMAFASAAADETAEGTFACALDISADETAVVLGALENVSGCGWAVDGSS